MKTTLKILLFAAVLAVMTGCSAQKRAERHVRKAVALCPEMVQTKAHVIDTVLTVRPWTDCAKLPVPKAGETLYAATDHGTVMVKLHPVDSSLCVGFISVAQQVRYQDTLSYAQVVVTTEPGKAKPASTAWAWIGCVLIGIVIGIVALFVVALKIKIVE